MMLQAMKGKLAADPELKNQPDRDGNPHKMASAKILYWDGREKSGSVLVHVTAWDAQAEALAAHKKDDVIYFSGRPDPILFKTKDMQKPHYSLGYTVLQMDDAGLATRVSTQFLRNFGTGEPLRTAQELTQDISSSIANPDTRNPRDIVLHPMYGKLLADPVPRTVTRSDGKTTEEIPVTNAILSYWNGKNGTPNASVKITAWGEEANALAAKKKDETLCFVGHPVLEHYKHESMQTSISEIGYNIQKIYPDRELVKAHNQLLNDYKSPVKGFAELVAEAKAKKAEIDPAQKTAPAKEEPTK